MREKEMILKEYEQSELYRIGLCICQSVSIKQLGL
ncbi:hypothetical protein B0O79_1258 [Flavobacteriaceae bacterium MAR_2009_75]|nr:hypothetical protein B0O79_1258 [Flavobacteriaceae bacterium MAR_2009_75]